MSADETDIQVSIDEHHRADYPVIVPPDIEHVAGIAYIVRRRKRLFEVGVMPPCGGLDLVKPFNHRRGRIRVRGDELADLLGIDYFHGFIRWTNIRKITKYVILP